MRHALFAAMRLADRVTVDHASGTMTMHYDAAPEPVTHRKRINRLRAARARRRRDWDLAPHSRAVFDEMIRQVLTGVMSAHPMGRHSYYTITDGR